MRRSAVFLLFATCVLLASCAATTPTASQPAPATTSYGTLPTSRTPEGYHVLGKTDAPVTITHYSDFL